MVRRMEPLEKPLDDSKGHLGALFATSEFSMILQNLRELSSDFSCPNDLINTNAPTNRSISTWSSVCPWSTQVCPGIIEIAPKSERNPWSLLICQSHSMQCSSILLSNLKKRLSGSHRSEYSCKYDCPTVRDFIVAKLVISNRIRKNCQWRILSGIIAWPHLMQCTYGLNQRLQMFFIVLYSRHLVSIEKPNE